MKQLDTVLMPQRTAAIPFARIAATLAVVALLPAQFAWIGCGVCSSRTPESPSTSTTVQSLDGLSIDPLSHITNRAVVLIFLSIECPICNKYAPEIRRLVSTYRPKDIEIFSVYPNPDESASDISRHRREYDLPSVPLLDPNHQLVRHSKATVTPEAVVFLANGKIVYRGRINDKFPRLGIERPEVTQQDLATVLEAIVTSDSIPSTGGPAIGCYISPRRDPTR